RRRGSTIRAASRTILCLRQALFRYPRRGPKVMSTPVPGGGQHTRIRNHPAEPEMKRVPRLRKTVSETAPDAARALIGSPCPVESKHLRIHSVRFLVPPVL